jgi:hypothetical protein
VPSTLPPEVKPEKTFVSLHPTRFPPPAVPITLIHKKMRKNATTSALHGKKMI